jgi:hypothetical protein
VTKHRGSGGAVKLNQRGDQRPLQIEPVSKGKELELDSQYKRKPLEILSSDMN